jgi:hypothetical protein
MHGLGGVPFSAYPLPPEADEAHREVQAAMAAAGPEASRAEVERDAVLFWALLHGLISLAMVGRVPGGPERAAELVEPAVRAILPPR